ncbi:MAG: hypothetical protein WCF12_01945 [Propionicimonas sp.]
MSEFNSAVAAGLFSGLCATLAGFAVSGIIFVVALLTREERQSLSAHSSPGAPGAADDPDVPLALLTAAFVGLVLSSLAYGLMAGEPPHSPRLAAEQIIVGCGSGTGALILLLAVRRLVCSAAPDLNRWTRHVVGIGAPCVVWLYLAEGTRHVGSVFETNQYVLWSVLGATGLVQLASGAVALWIPRRTAMQTRHFLRLASVGVLTPTVATAGVALTPTLFPDDSPPQMVVLYAMLTLCVLGTSFFTVHVGRAVRGETEGFLD